MQVLILENYTDICSKMFNISIAAKLRIHHLTQTFLSPLITNQLCETQLEVARRFDYPGLEQLLRSLKSAMNLDGHATVAYTPLLEYNIGLILREVLTEESSDRKAVFGT
ncbi:unnamed protein product [Dicrocoelium dendriticum]|nr:unnamed protein product [Dicrocoelium dendriticum]